LNNDSSGLGNASGNTALGVEALENNVDGGLNTAVGISALLFNQADDQTAVGAFALLFNNTATGNTAVGFEALFNNDSTGNGNAGGNTAVGNEALAANVDAFGNTAMGFRALVSNDSSGNGFANVNTAVGVSALGSNVDGGANTAVAALALFHNDTGSRNNAFGYQALYNNTTGSFNQAMGVGALLNNDTGIQNIAIGDGSLLNNVSGNDNTVVGHVAGGNIVGGTGNIYIGIGVAGPADEAGVIRIGDPNFPLAYDCFIAGIYNRAFGPADMAVRIGNDGKLGTVVSSRRFKHDIKPMDTASEAILALKPVTFHYNSDAQNAPAFGLIAEDVAEVSADLVIRDKEGKPLSVRYEDVNVMLLNEFLKEHRKNEEQEKTIAELKSGMTALAATVKEQASQIQKVSDQLEARKRAPQVVNNP